MNKDERARNMFTGLGAVMVILIGIILLPFIVPLVTALVSIGLTVLLAAFVIFLIIWMFTGIGSMINSARDGNTKVFTADRQAQGKEAWNSSRDRFGKWLWGLASKVAPPPDNNTSAPGKDTSPLQHGYIWCPNCAGARQIKGVMCTVCNGSGFIKDEPEHQPTGGTMECPTCSGLKYQADNVQNSCTVCNGTGSIPIPNMDK